MTHPTPNELDNPDNMTVTPRGGLLLCEDAAGNGFTQGERLVGLTMQGGAFTFAMNNIVLTSPYNSRVPAGDYRQNEWAGACYSPDGNWLFVNIQTPGITLRDHGAVEARSAVEPRLASSAVAASRARARAAHRTRGGRLAPLAGRGSALRAWGAPVEQRQESSTPASTRTAGGVPVRSVTRSGLDRAARSM